MNGRARTTTDRAALAATICAMAMIANQVAGKATRDAFFLSAFSITSLPVMLMGAAVISIATALSTAPLLVRTGPFRFVSRAFALSAAFLLLVWLLGDRLPRLTAVLVYVHIAAFGSILVSGFWSAVNERFDPRTARQRISRIATGGTIGGLVGGLAAERVAAWLSVPAMLPILAALHLICALAISRLRVGHDDLAPPLPDSKPVSTREGLRLLGRVPYLRDLALLVLLATLGAAFLDYLFKARATEAVAERENLMRFFAFYYTGASALTLLVQATLTRPLLQIPKTGLVRTVSTLPAGIVVGGVLTLLPGLATACAARVVEAVLHSSLFRSAYELFYTPLSPARKRASKSLIDVGFDRLGDGLGGGLTRLLLWAVPAAALAVLSVLAAVAGIFALLVALRLHRGYRRALEKSLLSRAVELDQEQVMDGTTRTLLLETGSGIALASLREGARTPTVPGSSAFPTPDPPAAASTSARALDPEVDRIAELRSGDAQRVYRALDLTRAPARAAVPPIIELLAWDELAPHATRSLRMSVDRIAGQLLDALLDPDEEFAVRRRLPRVLSRGSTQRVVDGLLLGLKDKRFEVRYQCGLALARIHRHHSDLRFPRAAILDAVLNEAAVDRRVWEGHRLLDRIEETDSTPFVDEFLRRRSSESLGHVFTVLSLTLPETPLLTAYKGLLTSDPNLRGTALEYLESVLPAKVRDRLWPFLDDSRPPRATVEDRGRILEELLQSNASIEIHLEELRKRHAREEDGEP